MPAHPPYEEQELLQRASLGDQHAFQVFFDHYWDRMYGNILYHCKRSRTRFGHHPGTADPIDIKLNPKISQNPGY